jgi:hypothetical protein
MGKYAADVEDRLILPGQVRLTREEDQARLLLGRVAPAPISVRFIVDTGSRRTTLVPGVIAHLQITSAGAVRAETSLATGRTDLFWVRLEFPGTTLAPVPEFAVARLDLPAPLRTYHGLIGRDLLRRWESLLYEGRRGRFTVRDGPRGWRNWLRGWLGGGDQS